MLLYSPAKINLAFRILGKKEDYHQITSFFCAIDLFDEIELLPSSEDSFFCEGMEKKEDNLLLKALKLFREKSSIYDPVEMHLKKRIPLMAGLGGGSSNAATLLFGLNKLFQEPFKEEELSSLGAKIGSDVPFFFAEGFAFCTGRGEIVEPLEGFPISGWIAKPSFGLSTKEVYARVKITKQEHEGFFYNELEPFAFELEPRLKKLKEALIRMGFEKVVMTGSGSALLCFGPSKIKPLEGIAFSPFSSIKRKKGNWYDVLQKRVSCSSLQEL